ncbi:MAG: hypothetical protein D8M57_11440 [Candidatus Scalindua sp. AMX11]|nr:MAG: hypothetical protein DWQ00_17750 [Candidatus Scalindua sp.]NOG85750.1 hypothetical protein [Planctomycetota bacterium]RZV73197.1 MAG: hypothetical protein EX341_13755 [Candidatus Scalindua sp. SCAELEC01]TDE64715.1 MAG: hypothetical protein D8M57_11440 [Candidatus Scalindua sp. AMX11]GJQ58724.1 MAG: CheY-P-specific phosphatase CheC [Candidatus Scalindua sp.]
MNITEEQMKILDIFIKICMDNASRVFSKTIKRGALIELVHTQMVDIGKATEDMNNDSREMVGAMLGLMGEFPGKLLFMIPREDALVLQDLYLGSPPGSTKSLDEYTEGTIQEIGNILGSSIGNTLAADFGSTILPTPPQVMCDFAGTIFQTLILEEAMEHDELILTETKFKLSDTEIDCNFFLIPDINTLDDSMYKLEKMTI